MNANEANAITPMLDAKTNGCTEIAREREKKTHLFYLSQDAQPALSISKLWMDSSSNTERKTERLIEVGRIMVPSFQKFGRGSAESFEQWGGDTTRLLFSAIRSRLFRYPQRWVLGRGKDTLA